MLISIETNNTKNFLIKRVNNIKNSITFKSNNKYLAEFTDSLVIKKQFLLIKFRQYAQALIVLLFQLRAKKRSILDQFFAIIIYIKYLCLNLRLIRYLSREAKNSNIYKISQPKFLKKNPRKV